MKPLLPNPLLVRQLREEMRSRKIFFLAPIFSAILSIVALVAVGDTGSSTFNPLSLAGASRLTLFSSVITISIVLGLISVIFGASSFTTEREKGTFELLELTPLSSTDLVMGKFLHTFLITGLVLLSSLPIFSTLFYMGGVTYTDLFLTLFYLLVFFAVVILAAICISIVSNRTILSIILSLAAAFVVSVILAILSTTAARDATTLGFSIFSPWLVTYQQIFAPSPIKIAGQSLPVWPFYLLLYCLLGLLFLTWARNALDSRKIERNSKARIFGLLLVHSYLAIGLLCMKSYGPIREQTLKDFYQILFFIVLTTLVFFTMGGFTDRDRSGFRKRPLLQSIHPGRLFQNNPLTGPAYLIVLLLTLALSFTLISGLGWHLAFDYTSALCVWILPWLLIFSAMRLAGFRQRGFLVAYGLGTVLYVILVVFEHSGKSSPSDVFDFFIFNYSIFLLVAVSIIYYAITRLRSRKVEEAKV
jgi:ABC-type transport system involved in cytochrome c biogenesis permease component